MYANIHQNTDNFEVVSLRYSNCKRLPGFEGWAGAHLPYTGKKTGLTRSDYMMSSEEHFFKDTGHSLNINEYECVIGSLTYPCIYQPIFANDAW